jgi:DNA-binding CsgD family transcriptional regulator/tetratricopeptide (TPR) repeat protein
MLETLREYGLERLRAAGEEPEMRRRHALLMTDLAEAAEPHLTSATRDPWMARLDADLDNIRAALSWSLSDGGDAAVGLRLAGALGWYWYFRGYFVEGRKWLEVSISQIGHAQSLHARAKALHIASVIVGAQGDRRLAKRWVGEAIEIWRLDKDSGEFAFALTMLGICTVVEGDVEGGCLLIEQGIEPLRRNQDAWRLAVALDRLGDALTWRSDYDGAAQAYRESMALFHHLGDAWGEGMECRELGGVALYVERYDEALQHYENALHLETRVGNKQARAMALSGLGVASFMRSDYGRSVAHFEMALSYFRELGFPRFILMVLRFLGYAAVLRSAFRVAADIYAEYVEIARTHGTESDLVLGLYAVAGLSANIQQVEESAKLLAFADIRRRKARIAVRTPDASYLETTRKTTRELLTNATWSQLSRSGEAMTKDEALTLALSVCSLAKQTTDGRFFAKLQKAPLLEERNPHGLSKREIELLSLVAVGLSNAEIATRLFLSPNTVRAHLYSIYSKIDVNSRTAAAHYARVNNLA